MHYLQNGNRFSNLLSVFMVTKLSIDLMFDHKNFLTQTKPLQCCENKLEAVAQFTASTRPIREVYR